MPRITLPVNPSISQFDFAATFDLTDGYLKINLSPSVIESAGGITGVTVSVETPTGNVLNSNGYAFTSTTMGTTYQLALPKAIKVFLWGVYKITVSLHLSGSTYHNLKTFNLCAPDPTDIFKNEGRGCVTMKVDCQAGKVKVSGLSGYPYRGKLPSSEVRNITFFYPTESEILAQKSISVVPFEMPAYLGQNVVKGVLISTYIFEDNISVKLRFAASGSLDVKCGLNMKEIFCAVSALYQNMYACQGEAQRQYCEELCRINGLIWLIYVGQQEGLDIEEHVIQLEQLLQINCSCNGCIGELVRPDTGLACAPVSAISASITGFVLTVGFNSTGISSTASAQVEYRTKGSAPTGPWTGLGTPVPITGALQSVNINVAQITQYEVRVRTLCPSGESLAITVDSNVPAAQNCVDITAVTGTFGTGNPPTTAAPTTQPPPTTITTVAPTTQPATTQPATTQAPVTTAPARTYNKLFEFATSTSSGIPGFSVDGISDNVMTMEINILTDPGLTPAAMNVYIGGSLHIVSSFGGNYVNQWTKIKAPNGTVYEFQIVNGDKNL